MEKIIEKLKAVECTLFVVIIGLAKGAKYIGEHTQSVERVVNKSMQVVKKCVNEIANKTPYMVPIASHAAKT